MFYKTAVIVFVLSSISLLPKVFLLNTPFNSFNLIQGPTFGISHYSEKQAGFTPLLTGLLY